MASIEYRARTTRVIAYVNKQKIPFVLGCVPKKTAERFANNIEALLNERRCNLLLSSDVSKWLAGLDQPLYDLLEARDLVEPRIKLTTLDKFIDSYIAARTDVGERRTGKLNLAKRRLVKYFGDVKLDTITPGAADEYAKWLLTQLSSATAHKECQIATQFFRHAFRKRLVERSPFDGVTVGRATNDDRRVFVTRKTIKAVLDKCPNWQWRTVLALARYGGLRCSSEVALLKWSDIHWDRDRFIVTSPKTTRYGKASRVVPIFPELRPFLDEAFSMADEGEMWVVNAGWKYQEAEPGHDFSENSSSLWRDSVGETISELPVQPTNGVGTNLPDLCSLFLARQHTKSCSHSLPNSDRRPLQ
ncbi:MAG: site-specific integrase [Pirellulaceae bacterium]